ncbi:MAG: hypothetical protein PHC34_05960 [Candidatus Gastranaerophilales bacterium]|nr:hypothetical protein [Candidatus Gastranaerophilales bacterium]
MAIGPQDYIDELLVQKYAEKQVNNIDSDIAKLTMSADRYWEVMRDYAQVQKMMLTVRSALSKPKTIKSIENKPTIVNVFA